jgi:hypothetical protein
MTVSTEASVTSSETRRVEVRIVVHERVSALFLDRLQQLFDRDILYVKGQFPVARGGGYCKGGGSDGQSQQNR